MNRVTRNYLKSRFEVFLAFGVVEDEGFVFVFIILWVKLLFLRNIVLLIGSLMGKGYA